MTASDRRDEAPGSRQALSRQSRTALGRLLREVAGAVPATFVGVTLASSVHVATHNAIAAPLYIPVVVYLAWTRSFAGALLASIAGTCARALLDDGAGGGLLLDTGMMAPGWSAVLRFVVYLSVGATVARLRVLLQQRDQLVRELRVALAEVTTLRGLLPMCAWCKHIRDDQAGGSWVPIDRYLTQKTATKVSHGICPRCAEKTFGSTAAKKESERQA